VFAAGDEPAEEMTVTLDPLDDPPEGEGTETLERQEITTDADGTFTVESVSTGIYSVSVDDSDAFKYDDPEIEVTESGIEDLEIHPDRALISGEVVDAETGEPISTEGDGEVNATIELVDTNAEDESSLVDAAVGGSYEFAVEEFGGEYEVSASATGYASDSMSVDAFGEQDAIELDPVTMSLSGQVTDSREGEEGIEGATVTVMTAAGQEFAATTDADGNYETNEAIPIGSHNVEVEADGYVTATETVEFEEEDVEQDFELDAEASMSGEATNDDGLGQWFTLELTRDGETREEQVEGEYDIDEIDPGTYDITAERSSFSETEENVAFEPAENRSVDLVIDNTGIEIIIND